MTDSCACFSRMATAIWAAAVASSPCPTPSTVAKSTPWLIGVTRCKSPETVWPAIGRVATPKSISDLFWTTPGFISTQPFFHGNSGSLAHFGINVKFVHQPFCSRQPHAQPFACGIAVLHGLIDVRNAGAFIASYDGNPMLATVICGRQKNLSAFGVIHDVACHFRDGSGDQRQIRAIKTQFHRKCAPFLARHHDVCGRADYDPRITLHV